MNGLIVVHTEMEYLDIKNFRRKDVRMNREVFERIGFEIEKYLSTENRVYYLAQEGNDPTSKLIYPTIRRHSPKMVFMVGDVAEIQFLRTKERIMSDKLGMVDLCGVAYGTCVKDLYHLLLGEEGPVAKKADYEFWVKLMNWSKWKFEEVFNTRLNAHIREDLTDKNN